MSKKENKLTRRRLANAYLSSIISISLVLLLIGVAALLIVNAGDVSNYFKENMKISVLMKQEVDEAGAEKYAATIDGLPYVRSTRVVSRQEGTDELVQMLGEGFLDVFESSPVPVSVDVTLNAGYVSADSLSFVLPSLGKSPLVDEVSCQSSLVDALNSNLARISAVLGVFIALLLFISFVLINNTVRINVFNKRFTIHAMQLVGATRSYICKPFIKGAVWQGLLSSVIAIGVLSGILFALRKSFPVLFGIFSPKMLALVSLVVLFCGVAICVLSTWMVVCKLIDSSKDELYY